MVLLASLDMVVDSFVHACWNKHGLMNKIEQRCYNYSMNLIIVTSHCMF